MIANVVRTIIALVYSNWTIDTSDLFQLNISFDNANIETHATDLRAIELTLKYKNTGIIFNNNYPPKGSRGE